MKVYGIKTCGSVKKALKFFNDNNIEYEFIDFKKSPVGCNKIDEWIEKVGIDTLFNTRGTKYRQLKLKELNLDDAGKREWLCKENLLIKRPVIEMDNGDVLVGFDEELYKKVFHGA
ncbi:arsenate reductase family protein [Nitratiruptor sp. SB155-2]|uniref:arsenate reductase family protein n=1 Tax=Nitratiruptor sp. (strain SB155-2) TaxID=387092 RepID=UPI00030838DB|nr:Spx/MgsR family RNA polymerase-binding regulatory protein [Nitratiruptor sp. SB155-2]